MFIQLKCENCGSPLNERSKGGYYTCPSCGSKYVFSDDEDGIIDVDKLISEGYEELEKENYDDAFDKFYLYKEACGVPSYEAYLGYLLSNYDCKNIEALVSARFAEIFECDMWHEVLKLAGEDREKLLNAKQEAPKNFQKLLVNKAPLSDAEIIDVSEIYIMYLAEYRKLNTFDQICETLDKIDSFDSMDNHYVIACTAKDKPAEYYWTEIEKATMFANNLLIIIPEPEKEKKPKFVEQMLEYHKKCDGLIVLAFCNDMNAIRKAHRYCHMVNFKPDYDSPKSGRNPGSAYMQGKRIILTGGNKKDADSFSYKSDEEKKEEEQQRNASVDQKANWIRNNRCRHCGGEFVGGIFSKTCSACGRKKDY